MTTTQPTTRPVQIRLQDDSGDWYDSHQVPAVLAALPAIGADITQYSGTYSDGDLRRIREALRDLDSLITRRIGS